MSTIDYPDYFKSCAERIRGACASPPAKRRFRAMLGEYLGERDRQTAARDAWERRRRGHFEAVPLLGLHDPGAEPPGEGWRFEGCDFDELLVDGWCPPELLWVNAPRDPSLLALAAAGPDLDGDCPADRALLLREKYAICAAIHDLVYSKLERIGPQADPPARSDETFKAAMVWEIIIREVAQLRDDDQVRVEAITKDVVADLGGVLKPAKKGKRTRTAAARPLTDLQRQALELYGTHNGKITEIARAMGISHATVSQHLNAAWRKLPALAPGQTPPAGRPRRLPADRRGQVNL